VITNELLCGFDGRFVIGAIQINCPDEMAIVADNVNSVLGHRIIVSSLVPERGTYLSVCVSILLNTRRPAGSKIRPRISPSPSATEKIFEYSKCKPKSQCRRYQHAGKNARPIVMPRIASLRETSCAASRAI